MYNLLIVEDEELERMALKHIILNNLDDINIIAETGCAEEALELDEKFNPDIIIMDINIIGDDGISVSNIIKGKNSNKIIIVITAHDEFTFAQRAIKTRVDDYLLKPTRPEQIVESIRGSISRLKTKDSEENKFIQGILKDIKAGDYSSVINNLYSYLDIISQKNPKNMEKSLSYFLKSLTRLAFEYDLDITHRVKALDIQSLNKKVFAKNITKIIDLIFQRIFNSSSDLSNVIKKVKMYLDKNIKKSLTLESVAEYANISTYYLSRAFKNELGVNFNRYIIDEKMKLAKDMLENTDMPITRIALELSYREPNYFSKVFKRIVGITPSEYRRRHKKPIMKRSNFIMNGRWYV